MKKILVGLISASLCFSIMQPVMAFENTNLIQAKKNTQKNIVDGIYNIQEDGQCLEIEGDNIAFRNPLEKAKTQKWVFAQADDGEFAIISLGTGYCFGISGKKDLDNAEISFSPYRGKSAQGWNLKKEKNGEFSIRSVLDPTYVLSFDEGASPSLVKEDTETPTYTISYVRDIMDYDEIESSINSISVDKKSNEKGDFYVKIEGAKSNGDVSSVILEVTPEGFEDKSKTFYVSFDENGDISYRVRARDFDYESGKYKVKCSLLLDGVYESEVGTYKCNVSDAMDNLKMDIEKLMDETFPKGEDWQICLRDLEHGKEFSINSHAAQSASMIKMFVMGTVYEDYDNLCKKYGSQMIDTNIWNVITASSNEAWMALLSCLGDGDQSKGCDIVTKWSHDHGYKDVDTQYVSSHNYCSVEDTTAFFRDAYLGKHAHGKDMINLFLHQQYRHKIPATIPNGVEVGNKTGDLNTAENDTAIVFAPAGTYVLSIMSTSIASAVYARKNLRAISSMIYQFLNY